MTGIAAKEAWKTRERIKNYHINYARRNRLVGKKFGRLTVLRRWAGVHWECRCECGLETTVLGGNLTRGNTRSCGCLGDENRRRLRDERRRKHDLRGRRFGRLVVIGTPEGLQWPCRCDCGATVVVLGGNLRSGNTQSCGCGRWSAEHRAKMSEAAKRRGQLPRVDQSARIGARRDDHGVRAR